VVNPVFQQTVLKQEDENSPKWLEDADLGFGRTRYIGNDEKTFWKDLIKKYLLPLERNEAQQKRTQHELLELRNKMSLMFFMINGLFIVIIFTLQVSTLITSSIVPIIIFTLQVSTLITSSIVPTMKITPYNIEK